MENDAEPRILSKKRSLEQAQDKYLEEGGGDHFYEQMQSNVKKMIRKIKHVETGGGTSSLPQSRLQTKKQQQFPKKKISTVPPTAPIQQNKVKSASSSSLSNASQSVFCNTNTVYVSGLPFECTDEEVRDFFKDCGTIKAVRLPKWHDSGKLRGYGHVEFASSAAALAALELSGQYIHDRFINVDRPMVPRALQGDTQSTQPKERPPGCKTIFIKNLPYDITEDELRQGFMVYGPIASIRLASWSHTQNLKGFGFVDFRREDSAEIAVKKTGSITIRDRVTVVDYEVRSAKKSFKGHNSNEPQKANKKRKTNE